MRPDRIVNLNRGVAALLISVALPLLLNGYLAANEKGKPRAGCTETNSSGLINPGNTCGSSSAPCVVDVKRTSSSASATPGIQGAKANQLFAVAVGTTVTWQSTSKDTGFVIDFGPSSPFDPSGAIMGGSDRAVSVVAKKPGCYRYSVGACVAGAIYGMCDSKQAELVVIAASK